MRTARLDLVAASVAHLEAELAGTDALEAHIGARVPPGWPPGEHDAGAVRFFRARMLEEGEAAEGWYVWYAIARPADGVPATLVGSCGYFGPPTADGTTEIGYSVIESMRGRGYATEMARALVARALGTPGVTRVTAEARDDNPASHAVLERSGFRVSGPGREADRQRWQVDPRR